MAKNLYIDASHPNETRVVLKSDDNIEDYEYESISNSLIKNNIYLGKVSRIEPSLQAAFVDFGRERHGFLSFNDIQSDYYQIPLSDLEKIKEEEEKRNFFAAEAKRQRELDEYAQKMHDDYIKDKREEQERIRKAEKEARERRLAEEREKDKAAKQELIEKERKKREKQYREEKEYYRVMQIKQMHNETREELMLRKRGAINTPEFQEARRKRNHNLFHPK